MTSKASRRSILSFLPSEVRVFLRGVVPLFSALSLLNASNYIFHVAVSRLLGPARYGSLAALLAVVLVLSVPVGILQTVVAKRTAVLRSEGRDGEIRELMAGTLKTLTLVGLLLLVVLLMASPLLAAFLHTGIGPAALLAPYALFALLSSLPQGMLQGQLRFGALSAVAVATVVTRLALGIGLVWAGAGVPGAILATVASQAIGLAYALYLLGFTPRFVRAQAWRLGALRGDLGLAMASLGGFWILAEIDVLLARHYLGAKAAGLYSSAGILARAMLFLPGAIALVALPKFAETHGRGEEARRQLRLSLVGVLVLVGLALPLMFLLRGQLVAIAFGGRYRAAGSVVPTLSAAMALLAVVNLLVYFHVAAATRAHRIVFTAIVMEAAGIVLFHGNAEEIAQIVLVVSAFAAGMMYLAARSVTRWRSPLESILGEEAGDRLLWAAGEPEYDLTVVLPCHNAGHALADVVTGLRRELEPSCSYEILVVSDGSTDETVEVARRIAGEDVRVIDRSQRGGKGTALRVGLSQARGRYVAFMDADGDIAPETIRPLVTLMDLYNPEIVLGSKRHPMSEVSYPALRRVLSWTYHKMARILFRVNVRDTQTGLKLIRRDVLAEVLPKMLEKRYAFDLELLVVARSLGYKRVFEAPIRLDYRFSSQVNVASVWHIILDTLAIFYRRYILGTYGRVEHQLDDVAQLGQTLATRTPGAARAAASGKLRVLFINWRDIRNPDAGGAEVVTHEIAKRWVQSGHEVTLLTSRFSGSPPLEVVDGVRIRRTGRLRNGSFHLLVQRTLSKAPDVDVIIDEINTIPFLTPLHRKKLPPIIALIHQLAVDVWDAEVPRALALVGRRIEPRLLRLYRETPVVTVSESTRHDLLEIGLGDVTVIQNGRDDPPPLADMSKEQVPTFLFVGRLTPNKRPDHAVEAFRRIREELPDAQLLVVGQGPMEATLRKRLPEGATMLGFLPREELYRRMAGAHCLLVPSVREGWGLVVIEANSVGTPAVAYDVPGLRDSIVDGRTGSLSAPDPAALAEAAVALLRDEGHYQRIRQNALSWSEGYSWDRTAREWLELVIEAADRPAGVKESLVV
ncbi:MAG: glycosyltransferase [Actinomycetota bacterium]